MLAILDPTAKSVHFVGSEDVLILVLIYFRQLIISQTTY